MSNPTPPTRRIWCCGCDSNMIARLTNGAEVYPQWNNRGDALMREPFWICDACGNYVGCHARLRDNDPHPRPLGVIATDQLRKARRKIHDLIDPVWKEGRITRNKLYQLISERIGWNYHTASIRSMDEAREVFKQARRVIAGIPKKPEK